MLLPRPQWSRSISVTAHTAKAKTPSSRRYVERQHSDPYNRAAASDIWRSRAAYKLLEIDDKFHIFRDGTRSCNVLDLGSAPGGWAQVAAKKLQIGSNLASSLIAVDLLAMDPIPGVHFIQGDFLDPTIQAKLLSMSESSSASVPRNVVLSDMMGNMTGNRARDEEISLDLCRHAFALFARMNTSDGYLVLKHFASNSSREFLADELEPYFGVRKVKYFKPRSSRKESGEGYWVCQRDQKSGVQPQS